MAAAKKNNFKPEHMNATAEDLEGNNGIGRYVFLPGSDGRAKEIAENFDNLSVKPHPRGHNLYLGTLEIAEGKVDVATMATGMGAASTEIIVHELLALGAKRFLRVGTSGSLQNELIHVGDLINVQATVRDEETTSHYAPKGMPAIASLEFVSSIILAAEKMGMSQELHTGISHCKSSLYAREFGAGPRAEENKMYLKLLTDNGVLASEMESSMIFTQAQIYNHMLQLKGNGPQNRVLAGSILSIVSAEEGFKNSKKVLETIRKAIDLALETVKTLAIQELIG